MWGIIGVVLYTALHSNLRKCLSENTSVFEIIKMLWALSSKYQIQFLLHSYVGMPLFWLHLSFFHR